MEAYYRNESVGPTADRFLLQPLQFLIQPPRDPFKQVTAFQARPASGPPMPLFFRTLPGGKPMLDWECYIQEKDNRLSLFLSAEKPVPEIFRLRMRRAHLAGPLESTNAVGCTISDLSGRRASPPLVVTCEEAHHATFKRLKWNVDYEVTLQLRSVREGFPCVRIDRLVCWGFWGLNDSGDLDVQPPAESPQLSSAAGSKQ